MPALAWAWGGEVWLRAPPPAAERAARWTAGRLRRLESEVLALRAELRGLRAAGARCGGHDLAQAGGRPQEPRPELEKIEE
eukprot:6759244-Lingulodinium_polyedra.AAC.1